MATDKCRVAALVVIEDVFNIVNAFCSVKSYIPGSMLVGFVAAIICAVFAAFGEFARFARYAVYEVINTVCVFQGVLLRKKNSPL